MIEGTIQVAVSIEYDNDCVFDVTVSKGTIEQHIHFYGDEETWSDFGERLTSFPENRLARVSIEVGTREYADFLFFEAYCYDDQGHAAVKIMMDNNQEAPHRCRLEFSIPAEVASINQLGRLLANWQVEKKSAVVWQAQTS